jgi:hypothetical protein
MGFMLHLVPQLLLERTVPPSSGTPAACFCRNSFSADYSHRVRREFRCTRLPRAGAVRQIFLRRRFPADSAPYAETDVGISKNAA